MEYKGAYFNAREVETFVEMMYAAFCTSGDKEYIVKTWFPIAKKILLEEEYLDFARNIYQNFNHDELAEVFLQYVGQEQLIEHMRLLN